MAVTGTEAQILEALLWYAGQLVTTPATKIANPGVGFEPSTGTPYLALTIINAVMVFAARPWIAEQVAFFRDRRANFFKEPLPSSATPSES